MKAWMSLLSVFGSGVLAASAFVLTACGSSPTPKAQDGRSGPETEVYSVVELHYTPPLQTACAGLEVQVPKFSFDSAKLSEQDRQELKKLANCLNNEELADEEIHVVGHADPRGTKEYNRDLGRERAEAVRTTLLAYGIAGSRIKVESRGEAEASLRPWDWPQERRVDIGVTQDGVWEMSQQQVRVIKPGQAMPAEGEAQAGDGQFEEREDTDGDGVDEPAVYSRRAGDKAARGASFEERGDPDGDGVDEPEKATDSK